MKHNKDLCQNINEKEANMMVFVVDKKIEDFIATIPSNYARFRICENPKNPVPISGFWPVLLDYRRKQVLYEVETYIGAINGAKISASILTNAYIYHGI